MLVLWLGQKCILCGSVGRKAVFLPGDVHSMRIKFPWFRQNLIEVDLRNDGESNGLVL